ncbi:unnamed protein product [Fraxinus pennsylvanica]|uniref:PPM-type phosphatase domain-containing protein n=1 Tax=Fraxinus pennsylvanica TaxID=56036 RepID=A0AAD2E777_9LAMI|nr:unnamed protein product [Fraxinus pennsylvanica]
MEKRRSSSSRGCLHIIKRAVCMHGSSPDTGKGEIKFKSSQKKGHMLGLFAIFDGHLGDRVPSYLKDNLFNNILEEPRFWIDPKSAIENAYHSTDKVILENSMHFGPELSCARLEPPDNSPWTMSHTMNKKDFIPFLVHAKSCYPCVMGNQEAVNMVRSIKNPQAAAKRLTTEALKRKSKDDISCIVIRFG